MHFIYLLFLGLFHSYPLFFPLFLFFPSWTRTYNVFHAILFFVILPEAYFNLASILSYIYMLVVSPALQYEQFFSSPWRSFPQFFVVSLFFSLLFLVYNSVSNLNSPDIFLTAIFEHVQTKRKIEVWTESRAVKRNTVK